MDPKTVEIINALFKYEELKGLTSNLNQLHEIGNNAKNRKQQEADKGSNIDLTMLGKMDEGIKEIYAHIEKLEGNLSQIIEEFQANGIRSDVIDNIAKSLAEPGKPEPEETADQPEAVDDRPPLVLDFKNKK